MSHLKPSTLALMVSAAIASTQFNLVAADLSQAAQEFGIQQNIQAANLATVSGMANQFDANTGETTFAWAPVGLTKPNLSAVAPEQQLEFAATFYLAALTNSGSKSQLNNLKSVMVSSFEGIDGVKVAKFRQELNGIEVFNKEFNVLMDPEFNLVAGSGGITKGSALKNITSQAQFDLPAEAIRHAFSAAGGQGDSLNLTETAQQKQYSLFTAEAADQGLQLVGTPRAKAVYFEKKNKLVPAHYVELEVANPNSVESDYFSYVISSETGEVLFKNNLKAHASSFDYRIYANQDGSPWDGPHGNVIPATSKTQVDATAYLAAPLVKLMHGPISTKDAWLKDDATITSGNNVFSYVDAIAPNGFTNGDYAAETTSPLVFDYKYRTTEAETSVNNRKAAIVNLFYMNNYLHDLFYDYGFDEKSGNAQKLNYGRGGVEGDPINAEVQDNSGFNNANMSTPADGGSPRMQMYLWDSKDATFGKDYGVTATANGVTIGMTAMQRSSFGQGQFDIEGTIAVFNDATAPIQDACQAAVNGPALAGKIAIVDRGTCNFTVKVKFAQDQGAIAVIVVNNVATGLPSMGGSDPTVKIPNIGVSKAEGDKIYAAIAEGKTVTTKIFNKRPFKDSSWDNAIVSHEWGHYISNRLVGNGNGLYNNQGRSMGEGWGDFHALLTVSEAKDLLLPGNDKLQRAYAAISYVDSFYYGIRQFPYALDKSINPKTFQNIEVGKGVAVSNGAAQVHSAGEVWAAVLWDCFVSLVNDERHSFDQAKQRMMGYLVNGYKMTPVGPTYTEARDAILAAAYAKDQADYKVLLKAFAERGMGLGAKSPDRLDPTHKGVVESTKTELSTFAVTGHTFDNNYAGLTAGFCTNDGILDNGETGTVSFKLMNRGNKALSGVKGKIEVTSGQSVTFANNGEITLPTLNVLSGATTTPVEFKLAGATTAANMTFKLSFPGLAADVVTENYSMSQMVNVGFAPKAPVNQMALDNVETLATLENFKERVLAGGDLAKGTQRLDGTYANLFKSFGHDVGQQYMFIANNGFGSDVVFETKAFEVGYGGDFIFSFWHYFEFEEDYDGGVVEISINGAAWVDVTQVQVGTVNGQPVYAQFSGGGYTHSLQELLPNRKTFTGFMDSDLGANESINFGSALNGNQVRLRFRAVSDSNTNEFGWFVDNMKVQNANSSVFSTVVAGDSVACDNRIPMITKISASAAEVDEGSEVKLTVAAQDANPADKLTYSWKQTSGPTATLTNANTAEVTVKTPAIITVSETLAFEVTVSDGTDSVKSSISVKVKDLPPAPPAVTPPQKSSGGSTGWFTLLLLPLAWFRRK